MNHQVVLLLTGCVQPNIKNDVLAIKDVETRKNQYLEAIDWYIKNTPYKIVFCENSGYDLKSEMAIRGGRQIEYLSFVASFCFDNRACAFLSSLHENTSVDG